MNDDLFHAQTEVDRIKYGSDCNDMEKALWSS